MEDSAGVNRTAGWQQQQQHYDRQVKAHMTTAEAMLERDQSQALPLRQFHNKIKQFLLHRFASGANRLLDLCCGRGGDIRKWIKANVRYVKGIDISGNEVQEASRRYSEAVAEFSGGLQLVAEFEQSAGLGASDLLEDEEYDVVTCMFAMHYFFQTEQSLVQFLNNVATNLKDGGYFIATIPDGVRVLFNLTNRAAYDSPCLALAKRWRGPVTCFGCEYSFAIKSTVTQADDESAGSIEYLVFTNVLTAVAATVGLYPVASYSDPKLDQLFEQADAVEPYKHFQPNFPGSDMSLVQASGIFMAVVFQKLASPPASGFGTAPPLPRR